MTDSASSKNDNNFDKFQKREGNFVLIPNIILSISLFIIILIVHGIFTETKNSAIVISFFIYMVIFQVTYSRKIIMVGGKSAEKVFSKFGYEKLSGSIIFMKKLHKIYLTFFFIIILTISFSFLLVQINLSQQGKLEEVQLQEFWSVAIQISLIPALGAINIMIFKFFLIYLDFNYFFSLGCFKIIQKYNDIWDRAIPYFIRQALDSYDNYLRRFMTYGIRNKDQICTKLVLQSKIDINESIKELTHSFSGDELDPLRTLSKFMGEPESNRILISDNVTHKIKEATPIILSLTATLFVILTFLVAIKVIPTFNQ